MKQNHIWEISDTPLDYQEAILKMEEYVELIIANNAPNKIWLLEHYDIYTKGTSADNKDVLANPYDIPIVQTKRGGKITYHGIGQRIIYHLYDLRSSKDIKYYINQLEKWVILSLKELGINAFTKPNMIGIWTKQNNMDKKIGAIGVRVRKWVAFHGISINVNPDINKFNAIVPCGISDFGVTSLHLLKKYITFNQLDQALQNNYKKVFNE